METTDIDYIGVLDYIDNYKEVPYSNPDVAGIEQSEKDRLYRVREKGQYAVAEMKKMANRCCQKFGLNACSSIYWLDTTYTKTRKYLWAQMKYKDYESNPTSVSIFVEKNDNLTRFRISLEIKDKEADKQMMDRYHSHLDIPKENGMVYVSGSNEWGNPTVISDTAEEIKTKINPSVLEKVQLCVYVESEDGKPNEQYDAEVMDAVKKIIPYYEYVIGKATTPSTGRAWLLTWNPQDWNWNNYRDWCNDTRLGKRFIESWTCASTKPSVGDEIFLMKTGARPRGILAHGYVHKRAYQAPHHNPERAAAGDTSNHIDVEFDRIQNYEKDSMLMQDDLRTKFPNQTWSPRRSGIEIIPIVIPELKKMWLDLIGKNSDDVSYWPSLEEGSEISYDKNMILYGPPGTGKTYSTAIYAVAICDQLDLDIVKAKDYNKVMIRYRELLTAGRVSFTTFHQSYGYEEFIEGIKPVLDGGSDIGYTIEDGVFKKFCNNARIPEKNDIQCFGDLWEVRNRAGDPDVSFDIEDYLYKNGVIMVETSDEYDKYQCNMISKMKKGDWVVLGRDIRISAIGVIDDEEVSEIDCEPFHWKRKVNWLLTGLSANFSDIGIIGGNFSNFAVAKSKYKVQNFYKLIKTENKPYVFIIDEINRGNISKIFGELITLIEDTKREGMDEQVEAILPYSGESFSVPSNVYILGTMNTADRSIALMDTALRRRFQFVEMMPDANVLRAIGADKVDDLDVAAMLEKINERIKLLYDREHTIGHAFFTKLATASSVETLKAIFVKSIIPLLQEYFYEDFKKIQLVLGDNGKTDISKKFILDEDVNVRNIFKGNADDVVDLPDKKYRINSDAFNNLESYKQIM